MNNETSITYTQPQSLIRRWTNNSGQFDYSDNYIPLFIFSFFLGFVLFTHNFYLKQFQYSEMRVVSEICYLSMTAASCCFLYCLYTPGNSFNKTFTYNILADSFFAPICSTCDTYLTYKRYIMVTKKATVAFKLCVILYCILFLTIPWFPFYNIMPIWYNQNTDYWKTFRKNSSYITVYGGILFYMFFFVCICIEYRKINTKSISVRVLYLIEFILRSLGHTFSSTIALVVMSMMPFPRGTVYIFIINSIGIHVFLNWNYDMAYFLYLINKERVFILKYYFMKKNVVVVNGVTVVKEMFFFKKNITGSVKCIISQNCPKKKTEPAAIHNTNEITGIHQNKIHIVTSD